MTTQTARMPNILLIVADDLGFCDLGAFGGELTTPHLDALAHEGRMLTGFHVAPACSPTRAMLFSGTDHHLTGLGQMAEHLHQFAGWRDQPGYEGYLNERSLSMAEILRDHGYQTCMSGKWHLGREAAHSPAAKGFERSFALLGGAAHYFTQQSPHATPEGVIPKALYREDGELVDLPQDFYATDFYTDKLIGYLEAQHTSGDTRPFFAYAAYTAPHWPLQAPDHYLTKFRGQYDEGYAPVRARRLARMKALGVLPQDFEPYPGLPASAYAPSWDDLTIEERRKESRRMEVYAAMVSNLDDNIGRLLAYLKRTGHYEDTFIFFMSDNGPDGLSDERAPLLAYSASLFDNRLENMGRVGSFVAAGPRWAEVSATPFRATKATTAEGGITAAAIMRLPRGKNVSRVEPLAALTHVTDLLPTILQLAGIADPGASYRGRSVHAIAGTSMLAYFRGEHTEVHDTAYVLGEELFGQRALQRGPWKLLWLDPPWGNSAWQLYNIAANRAETNDLTTVQPEIAAALERAWQGYVERNGVILCPYPTRTIV
ncbi:MAG: arylsulfatase [Burkholderiales bacterium]